MIKNRQAQLIVFLHIYDIIQTQLLLRCPGYPGIIGKRVQIPYDPVTVTESLSATCHCPKGEKARNAKTRSQETCLSGTISIF